MGFDSKRLQVPDPGRDFSSCVPDAPPRHESAPTPCWPPAPLSVVLTAHAMQIAIILLFAGPAVKRNFWTSSERCPSKRRGETESQAASSDRSHGQSRAALTPIPSEATRQEGIGK